MIEGEWGNGLAEGRYVRAKVGAPGTRLCVLWLADSPLASHWSNRVMLFFGLPFLLLAGGVVGFLRHPGIPFHRKVTETVLAPVKSLYFIATGNDCGLWEMDW